jgi:hypothetical protein
MSYNRSPLAFDDVREAFERALGAPKGIRVVCKDRGAAFVLRSRFNYFRTLDREENRKTYQPDDPMYGKSVYDRLILRIPPKGDKDEHVLLIEPRSVEAFDIEDII